MKKIYKVKQGDCISSIAFQYGFFPGTIWDHPDNAILKTKRKDPNILFPGDEVVIPEKQLKEEACEAEQRHCFRRKGVPEMLRIRFLDEEDTPRRHIPYVITVKTKSGGPDLLIRGETDEEGFLEESISPDADTGTILLGEGDDQETHEIMLGHIDPSNEISGVQARLNNLGYSCGDEDGILGERTRDALQTFQKENDLEVVDDESNEISDETIKKLEEFHLS